MKSWIGIGITLLLVVLVSACVKGPEQGTGRQPTTIQGVSHPTPAPTSAPYCEEYTSSARSVFVSQPEQEGNDVLFAYEDGFGDTSLGYLTVKVNAGTTWSTTEPWGVLGTGRGVKPGKGAEFRVRGEGTAGLDRVVITAHFTDGPAEVIRIACV